MAKGKNQGKIWRNKKWKPREIVGTDTEEGGITVLYYNDNLGDCLRLKSGVTSIQKSSLLHTFLNHFSI